MIERTAAPEPRRTVLVVTYRFPPQGGGGVQRTLKIVNNSEEKMALTEAIQVAEGDRSRASRLLGIERPVFHERLKEYGLAE